MTCCKGNKCGCIVVAALILTGVWIAHAHHRRKLAQMEAPRPLIGFPAEVSPAPPMFRTPAIPDPPRVRVPVVPPSPDRAAPAGESSLAHWPPEPGDGFDADVELSPRAAVQSAARQAARLAGGVCTDLAKVTDVSVSIDRGEEGMADVREAFQTVLPQVELTYVAGETPATVQPAQGRLRVTIRTIDAPPARVNWSPMPLQRGSVEAMVIGPDGVRRVEVRFEEKPWAADLSAFAAAEHPRQWVVGQSTRPCATKDEANRAARADAARQLALLAQGRFPGGRTFGRPIGERTEAALAGGRFVADRLTRRFHRDYGDVWYDAVLVDASPANLQALADETTGLARARRASLVARVASGAAMVAVIFILYVVVNAFTRGYFVWRLRAATALVLVVAVGALLVLAAVG